MGRDADGEEEKHHMKLTEKAEGSICCDMKTITLKKAEGKCWVKGAWNTKLWNTVWVFLILHIPSEQVTMHQRNTQLINFSSEWEKPAEF